MSRLCTSLTQTITFEKKLLLKDIQIPVGKSGNCGCGLKLSIMQGANVLGTSTYSDLDTHGQSWWAFLRFSFDPQITLFPKTSGYSLKLEYDGSYSGAGFCGWIKEHYNRVGEFSGDQTNDANKAQSLRPYIFDKG